MNESANRLFRILVWLFLVAVVAQVFLAGLVTVARQSTWSIHEGLGHALGLLLIAMLFVVHLSKGSRQVILLSWALFLVWIVQVYVLVIFLRQSVPYLAAFHPVLALADFWLALRLLAASKAPNTGT